MFVEILKKIWLFFIDTLQTILLAASVFLVIYMFLFRPFQVSGQSMFPTFHDKEYILTNLIGLRFEDPKKGDVIVFRAPTDPDKEFIKRVIAVPDDTVELRDGSVYVNGELLDESIYLNSSVKTYGGSFLTDGEVAIVPEGQYLVFGDNRPASSDSREWGFLKKTAVTGKSFLVYWPLNKFHLVENPF
ncbi:MAG: signal peptidase I [Candidatus Levybacteria bacterium]|nr:signal peptidase I [Candidatus Levybacteria bacterium]